jgi:hypothetical protein
MNIIPAARWSALVVIVGSLLVVPAGPALSGPALSGPGLGSPGLDATAQACVAPVPSTTQPGYTVADPNCDLNGTPFQPLTDGSGKVLSRTYAAIENGAAYRMEVPLNWNGELAIYAHGYRGTGTTVFVDNAPLRAHFIAKGFAWAASSYQTNGYDVGQGVRDSHALIAQFARVTGTRAKAVYMTGMSMGGHVTGVAIEKYRGSYVGAMPSCGVLGDAELFDYFLDATVTAGALARVPVQFPLSPPPDFPATFAATVAAIQPVLGVNNGAPPALTAAGRQWSNAVERRSGGDRPGFEGAFAFWNTATNSGLPFLFGVYPGTNGGTIGVEDGNVTSNRTTWYELDNHWLPTWDEIKLNLTALRVGRTAEPSPDLTGVPKIYGDPRIPVLSLHNIGDLFVPLSMEQIYLERALARGQAKNVVSRAIRANGHCDFTAAELTRGFDDLVSWVRGGHKPAGDAILDPRTVAAPTFGCRFTVGVRPDFVAPACG